MLIPLIDLLSTLFTFVVTLRLLYVYDLPRVYRICGCLLRSVVDLHITHVYVADLLPLLRYRVCCGAFVAFLRC